MTKDVRCQHGWVTPPECPQCCAEERDRLKEELESHAWEITPAMAQAKLDELNREIERLKSSNARLAAHNAALKDACRSIISPIRPHWRTTMELASKAVHMDPTDALRDLLAPTIKVLEGMATIPTMHSDQQLHAQQESSKKELARLRAACGEGK